jgi:4-hydroxybenzoate polyprenyltransferase
MRSAGCVINDYADRHWDGAVERTCQRPLATGEVTEKQALTLFAGLLILGLGLVLTLNPFTILLSIGAVVLATLYPFTKRFTYWPQLFLGAAFAWAVPMAYAAVLNAIPLSAWLVFAITMLWTLIYDTYYAMVDREDDLKVGIKSTAIAFGEYDRIVISLLQAFMLGMLLWLGEIYALTSGYYLALVMVGALFGYHQWITRHQDKQACFKAFKQNHWAGLLVLVGIAFGISPA